MREALKNEAMELIEDNKRLYAKLCANIAKFDLNNGREYRLAWFDYKKYVTGTSVVAGCCLFFCSVWKIMHKHELTVTVLALVLISLAVLLLNLLWVDKCFNKGIIKISTAKDVARLRKVNEQYNLDLAKHEETVKELQESLAKFENLRPLVEKSLGGKMERSDGVSTIFYDVNLIVDGTGQRKTQCYSVRSGYDDFANAVLMAFDYKKQVDDAKAGAEATRQIREQQLKVKLAELASAEL